MGFRILIIKLAALGDVVRTAALLPGLKEVWPSSYITWVTRPGGVRILANHPLIDRLLPFDAETILQLEGEHFDVCLSLDKEPAAAGLAMRVNATCRRGIGLSRYGTVFPLNPECVPYFRLGLDDDLKFRRNTKSYPQLIYEAVGLTYAGQRYRLYPRSENRRAARQRWASFDVAADEVVVGLNTGAGEAFANKTWPEDKFAQLAEILVRQDGYRVALLGGPAEAERNRRIAEACAALRLDRQGHQVPGVVNVCAECRPGPPPLSELDFVALVARCNVVVTGDTFGMHVAIAQDVPVVALFGPTCPQEVELSAGGEKVCSMLPCAPCYRRSCRVSPSCMDDISVESVSAAVRRWCGKGEVRRGAVDRTPAVAAGCGEPTSRLLPEPAAV